MAEILAGVVVLILLVLLVWFVVSFRFSRNSAGGASLTAMHDFAPQDKQHAFEYIIEQKAGKRMSEDENGGPPRPGAGDGETESGLPQERIQQ
ncbi:MAG TPA: hypothetical protein VMG09_17840 [Bacteroidota bacterium]|nr:hypothetical protein [Bacteroidota bacterium]